MRTVVVVAMLLASCSSPRATIDAGMPVDSHEDCPPPESGTPDFFGESCIEGAFPAVTACHSGAGWCVSGVCRPACKAFGCRRCDFGSYVVSARGACYCSP